MINSCLRVRLGARHSRGEQDPESGCCKWRWKLRLEPETSLCCVCVIRTDYVQHHTTTSTIKTDWGQSILSIITVFSSCLTLNFSAAQGFTGTNSVTISSLAGDLHICQTSKRNWQGSRKRKHIGIFYLLIALPIRILKTPHIISRLFMIKPTLY